MLIFYHQDSKKLNYKCFGGKLMQKLEEVEGITCLAHKLGPALSSQLRLSVKKPKGSLSAKARAKHEVA